MSGAWEIRAARRVLTGILHVDTTTVAWSLGLRNLILPGPILPLAGMPYDMARNVAGQQCLAGKFEYLFFLDSDVIPPSDAVPRLIAHRQPIVSGVYYRRSPPHGIPVMLKNGQWLTQLPENRLIDVDFVGAGCLLIHRTVLENLPPICPERGRRWFDWRVDMAGLVPSGEALSEDFSFDLHARRHGYRIYVDTSIRCRHIGAAQAVNGRMEPLETAA